MIEEGNDDHNNSGSSAQWGEAGNRVSVEPDDRELQASEDSPAKSDLGSLADGGGSLEGLDEARIEELLREQGVPESAIRQVSLQVQEFSYFRKAPLPAPAEFEAYERVLPGAADRIMSMAENSLEAQIHSMEGAVDDAHTSTNAEAFAFRFAAVAVSGLPWFLTGLAVFLVLMGQEAAAIISASGAAISAGPQLINSIRGTRTRKGEE